MFGETYTENPRFLLSDADFHMLRLWRLFRPGLGGAGYLPDPGGIFDQAAVMLEAFQVMSAAEAELEKATKS